MPVQIFFYFLELLKSYQLPNGGFPYHAGEEARPDATAWAVIAIAASAFDEKSCSRGRAYLVSLQEKDGRVSISPTHPDASWPTPLAILAWQGVSSYDEAKSRAINYLLSFTGLHFPNPDYLIIGHDTSILGWPWVANTHSWIIPTALALLALQEAGLETHARAIAGTQLLLNRQLKSGGWNFGSTTVFQRELHPLPECTAIALQALARNTPLHQIKGSLDYLLGELPFLRTPISLAWTLMGLGAWGLRPANAEELVIACLQRQTRYGAYPVPSLALLLCAMKASQGLHFLFGSSSPNLHSVPAHF